MGPRQIMLFCQDFAQKLIHRLVDKRRPKLHGKRVLLNGKCLQSLDRLRRAATGYLQQRLELTAKNFRALVRTLIWRLLFRIPNQELAARSFEALNRFLRMGIVPFELAQRRRKIECQL